MGTPFTAFPTLVDELGIPRRHLVHVGAHEGQEVPFYVAAGFERITLVEPIPALAARLRRDHPGAEVVECACSDQSGRATLTLMWRSNMSTLRTPGRQDRATGSVQVLIRRLDDIAPDANVAVVDAQGLELEVLAGAALERLDMAIVETCTVPDPTVAAGYDQVTAFMAAAGFVEARRWVRDYQHVMRWARGRRPTRAGQIRDVIYVKEQQ